ncbi:hypothetical protein LSM04_003005 [Trypanosoma melophagium]|uniref:uncharacterized protein n=1 Tax=Trypanosoma melophagium TaxID=715481 RepID=UPI00351AA293|nr:hypothetical protein LSM04_003005 [Trypanosoma melophagium]
MSVRHLGGALRWVVVESLEERVETMRGRLERLGLTEREVEKEEKEEEGGKEEALKKRGGAKEEDLLRGIERLRRRVHAERRRCARAGARERVEALDRELLEAAELKNCAAQYLKISEDREGKAHSEPEIFSSEYTSEGSHSSSSSSSSFSSFSACSSNSDKFSHSILLSSNPEAGIKNVTADSKGDRVTTMRSSSNQDNEEIIRPANSKGNVRVRSSQKGLGGWMADMTSTTCSATNQASCFSAIPRRPQPQSDLFRIYGVALALERPQVNRPASSQVYRRRYSTNTAYTSSSSNVKDANVRPMERAGSATDGIKVVDASGTGVSVVMRRMVRPTVQNQKQNRDIASASSVNRTEVTRRPVLTVRRDLKIRLKPQGAIPGFREANEAAAVAVDAAMAAVAAFSTSAPSTPRAPHTPRSSFKQNSLNQRSSKSRFSRERGEEGNNLKERRPEQSLRSYRNLDTNAAFVQLRREEGNKYVQNKQYEEAVQAYSEAIERDPDNDILLCNRAVAYLLMNQHTLALMDCETVLRRSPSNLKAHWRAARALLYGNKVQDAKRHYRIALQLCIDPTEERNIADEMKATRAFEMYYTHMKESRWTESVSCADQLLRVFGSTGICSLPWHCLKLEALLHIDSWRTLDYVKRRRVAHPTNSELMFIHAKCLFFCAHDPKSTREALELIRAARCQKENEGNSEDSRFAHLERTISSFERHRDRGNNAYENGDWSEAYMAYTRCLSLDPLNKSLIAVTYCNRAAACMQGGRWDEALGDIHRSIQVNSSNAKAYARRARIYLQFLYDRAKAGIDYLELAINDLTKAVELAPTEENQKQLAEVIHMRRKEEYSHGSSSGSNKNDYTEKSDNEQQGFRAGHSYRSAASFDTQRKSSNGQSSSNNNSSSGNKSNSNGIAQLQSKTHCARVLGLDNAAGLNAKLLARAYHEAALRWHPDKWIGADLQEQQVAEQKFKEINMAYQSLKEMFVRC